MSSWDPHVSEHPVLDETRTDKAAWRVALVHDDLTQRGGAERVVLSLHRLFPDAPVYTGVYDPDGTFPEFRDLDVRVTGLQRLPHRGNASRALLPLYPMAFERLHLRGYDLVVSSSSRFGHGVRVEEGLHVCYCHSPARFLYDADRYLTDGGPVPRVLRPAVKAMSPALRRWDRRAAQRPDLYVANSYVVAERIRRLYGREAPVVHPPVDVRWIARTGTVDVPLPPEPFFLVISRLLPYKGVGLAVRACRRTGRRLVIVGDGPAEADLRVDAGPGIEFRGEVTDRELAALLHRCEALIQVSEEDFGIVPLEANAAGRPVVAYGAGGALETVVDGVTGTLFEEQSEDAIIAALEQVEATAWEPDELQRHADTFGEPRFHAELLSLFSEYFEGRTAADTGRIASEVGP